MSEKQAAPRQNRLAEETSPYLLQHASNPVDWHPWGPEALARAKAEDKPILLSIGYAACHWCHVMERESFEDEAIARQMNEHFVCVKVDREERPDLDEIYMAATVAMSGSGGWPMTVALTPDQRPFFAGTYFPPSDRFGRPGFPTLLSRIAEMWREDRDTLLSQAAELTEVVRAQHELGQPAPLGDDTIDGAVKQLSQAFDERWGGFGTAPKFPPSAALHLLLRYHRRTGDDRALQMVRATLDGMKNGGLYDHVGGGFARYSTDERWLVPHFEKMLYDNAQLARVYLEAFQVTKDPEYQRVARETLDYVLREMQSPEGGYFSATDADSEGVEGKFFVWSPDQIAELLEPDDAERFCLFFDISPEGNWEGHSIPNTPRSRDDVARELGIARSELDASLARGLKLVYEARQKRVPPLLDDKILGAWNGLMIGAMAEGARVLGDGRYLQSAERAARDLLTRLRRPDGGLYRTARGEKAHLDAVLEDYAYLADGLIDLSEAGAPIEFLQHAEALCQRMLDDFGDETAGAFYFTAHEHESLISRTREGNDGALPNANAVAARALARLASHYDRPAWRERATAALRAYGKLAARAPRSFATSLAVADFLAEPPVELVFAGGVDETEPLRRAVAERFLPNRVVAHVDPGKPERTPRPLVAGKGPVNGRPALYVCRNFTCQAPVTEPGGVADALTEHRAQAKSARQSSVGATRLGGRATGEATRAHVGTLTGDDASTPLCTTGLVVSRLGFGGYRVDDGDPEHRKALRAALRAGWNLIDTSTNYTDGRSERLIGEVLAEREAARAGSRAGVVVVSKIGYVQGRNLELAEEREAAGEPFPEMVKVGRGIWHCVHPTWLEDQLTRSLDRLGLETLDVCLLHNPEYFFADAVRRGEGPLSALRETFYARLEAAFRHFELEREGGRIAYYGVSSNSVVSGADDREATNLERMLAAAEAAGGSDHGFRVLQCPVNLIEGGAALEQNHGGRSVLDVARERGIAVLVNRPLNAITDEGLVRLADPPPVPDAPPVEASLARVAELEREFRTTFAPSLRTAPGSPPPQSLLAWAEQLAKLPPSAHTLAGWNEIERDVIVPRTRHVLSALSNAMRGPLAAPWEDFSGRYEKALDSLLAALRARAAEHSRERGQRLHRAVAPHVDDVWRSAPLSQLALGVLLGLPGVTSVLLGARRTEYVRDGTAALARPRVTRAVPALAAVAGQP